MDLEAEPVRLRARFALFETELGWCGIVWAADGVLRLQLPEGSRAATRAKLVGRLELEEAPALDGEAAAAAEGVAALLAGRSPDLDQIRLDWREVAPLPREVYRIARAIPRGQTRTYGDIARELGDVSLSQTVGQALGRNPFAPVVPCHRVLKANGGIGGFSAGGGAATKLQLLNLERAGAGAGPLLFDDLPLTVKGA